MREKAADTDGYLFKVVNFEFLKASIKIEAWQV